MITVEIDKLVPCLKNVETGDIVETEVVQLTRKSFLAKFNEKTGWFTNWAKQLDEHEVFALVIKGTMDVQGLVSVRHNEEAKATYASWMCANPESVKTKTNPTKKYEGIGGHLFAIAIDKSLDYGDGGAIYGYAASEKLLLHYMETFGALYVGIMHQYHFVINEEQALPIKEAYTYEWTTEVI